MAEAPPTWPLCAAIARGDEHAFAAFYEAWFDRVLALARKITRRDEAFGLDVVQDVMLRVVRAMKALPDEPAVAAWMARVVWSTAVDRLRQEARRTRREQAAGAVRAAQVEPHDDGAAEELAWLRAQLAALPAGDRALLGLRFEEGLTLDETGQRSGISGDAAHGRIQRILGRLRRAAQEVFGHGR